MANNVGDTWQVMCHNAWQRPMHVGHMACHVSTCMALENAINIVWELFVEGGSSNKEKEGKKKGEGKKGKKERKRRERRKKKGKEKEGEKESSVPTVGTRQTKK